ncbi:hypothetical protein Tco_0096857 [Tanacetum coccineum]
MSNQPEASSSSDTTRKSRTGDQVFPGDICRPGNVTKRQKSVRRGTNSDRLFSQSMNRVSRATCRPCAAELTVCCSEYIYISTVASSTVILSSKCLQFEHCHFLKFPENSFEVLKLPENSVEVLKILENKLESMKILENKLESLKLQDNQPVDGLVPLSLKKFTSESVFEGLLKSKDNKF